MEFLTATIELVLFSVMLVEPVLGKRSYQRLREIYLSDQSARARFYREILVMEWGWAALIIAYAATLQAPPALLGLSFPGEIFQEPLLIGALIGLAAGVAFSLGTAQGREFSRQTLKGFEPMLPESRRERWLFAAVSLTAGICEELLWRGFLFAALERYAPGIHPAFQIAASALLFGVAHAYQGIRGILSTGLLGLFFAYLYVKTGSLLIPIIVHALIDLRVLLLVQKKQEERKPHPDPS